MSGERAEDVGGGSSDKRLKLIPWSESGAGSRAESTTGNTEGNTAADNTAGSTASGDKGDGGTGEDGGQSGVKDGSEDSNAEAKRPKPAHWHEMNKKQRKNWKARNW
jgi:hypothetical protein